jgi:hypothetical protein
MNYEEYIKIPGGNKDSVVPEPMMSSIIRKLPTAVKAGKSNKPFRERQRQEIALPKPQAFGSGPRRRSRRQQSTSEIDIIKHHLGDYQHHGTGNPLAARSPTMPRNYAVRKLADIINHGHIGQTISSSSTRSINSTNSSSSSSSFDNNKLASTLKTERGRLGSFWTTRLRLAGSYGWTGIILPKDTYTSKPFPVENSVYFILDNDDELQLLKSLVDPIKWSKIESKAITTAKLANQLKN